MKTTNMLLVLLAGVTGAAMTFAATRSSDVAALPSPAADVRTSWPTVRFAPHRPSATSEPELPAPDRARIEAVGEAVRRAQATITTPAQLRAFLAEQEERARVQGRVSALEIEPALAAIRRVHAGAPSAMTDAIGRFTSRMGRLARATSPDSPSNL